MTVLGVGFSNSLTQYAEVDREPLEGLSYYRLKQIDFDGQYSYSDPVAIVNNQFMVDENFIVFPNPAREGYVFIKPPSISSGYLSLIRLFDSSGKLIHKEIYDELTDVHRFYFGKLTPGIYFIEFSNEDKSQTKKIIID
jgi:hypothetical protein